MINEGLNPAARGPVPSSVSRVPSTTTWSLYQPLQRWGFLAILFLVITSNYLDYYVLSVVLEPIKKEFHISDTMLGLLTGSCFAVVYGLTAFPIARWADRGNRRTVITCALAGWSVMTAVCGLAQSFWQLALARFGVGAAEPGAVPAAQSLIADYFPPGRRAMAIAILTNGGSAVGWLVGVGLGGLIAVTYGWRTVFVLAGASGLALAVFARFMLPEPRSGLGLPSESPHSKSLLQTMLRLARKRSLLFALAGFALYAIFAYGVTVFVPSFMIRSLNATIKDVSVPWGGAIATANILGALAGGWLADRLSRHDIRWYVWLPAAACVIGTPPYWLAFSLNHLGGFIAAEFLGEAIFSMGIPIIFVAILTVCGNHRRALASAAANCLTIFIGGTVGPLLTGTLSDTLISVYGPESLRHSLLLMCIFPLPAAILLYWASRTMLRDRED